MGGRPSGLLASPSCRAEALPHVTDAVTETSEHRIRRAADNDCGWIFDWARLKAGTTRCGRALHGVGGRYAEWAAPRDRKRLLDRAARLEPGREHEGLAEVRAASSTAKPGPSVASSNSTPPGSLKYTDLNQKRSMTGVGSRADCFHLRAHGVLMLFVVDAPREMVHRSDAPGAAAHFRRVLHVDDAGGIGKPYRVHPLSVPTSAESKDAGQKSRGDARVALPDLRAVRPRTWRSAEHGTAVPRGERSDGPWRVSTSRSAARADRTRQRLVSSPKRFSARPASAVALKPRAPEVEAPVRHLERDLDRQAMADARTGELRPTEKT